MTGPTEPRMDSRIATYGDLFLGIKDDQNPPRTSLTAPVPIVDGPLSQGLGGLHNELSLTGERFVDEMVRGMTDTGELLKQVIAEFESVDQATANDINTRLAQPPDNPGDTAPGGGR